MNRDARKHGGSGRGGTAQIRAAQIRPARLRERERRSNGAVWRSGGQKFLAGCNRGAAAGHLTCVDRDARFEWLYRTYAGRVRAYTLRRASSAAADDVVAEVFLVAWRRLEEVPEDAFPWLLGVARRILANRRRGEQRSDALLGQLAEQLRSTRGGLETGDERALRALARLSERDQELLFLAVWEELDHGALAQVLGIRKGTVAVRLHRARRRLQAALLAEDAHDNIPVEVSR